MATVISYRCSKCGHQFELKRPQSKATEHLPCPKCGQVAYASPRLSFTGPAPLPPGALQRRTLPGWARGQVESQVRQMVVGRDTVGEQEVELVTQEVLRELSLSDLEVSPGNIRMLAQKHLEGLDSWARTARRSAARMDALDKLDEEG